MGVRWGGEVGMGVCVGGGGVRWGDGGGGGGRYDGVEVGVRVDMTGWGWEEVGVVHLDTRVENCLCRKGLLAPKSRGGLRLGPGGGEWNRNRGGQSGKNRGKNSGMNRSKESGMGVSRVG